MESNWSDELDASLEEQLKLTPQFKLPGKKTKHGYMVHEYRCGGVRQNYSLDFVQEVTFERFANCLSKYFMVLVSITAIMYIQ